MLGSESRSHRCISDPVFFFFFPFFLLLTKLLLHCAQSPNQRVLDSVQCLFLQHHPKIYHFKSIYWRLHYFESIHLRFKSVHLAFLLPLSLVHSQLPQTTLYGSGFSSQALTLSMLQVRCINHFFLLQTVHLKSYKC